MAKNKYYYNSFMVFVSLCIISLRPSIIGENYGPFVLLLITCMIFLQILIRNNAMININTNSILLSIFFAIFFIYVGFQSIFTATNFRPVLSSIVSNVILFTIFLILTTDKKFILVFNKTLIITLVILVFSSIITYFMFYFESELSILKVQTHQGGFKEGYAALYFPFSIMGANAFNFNFLSFERSFGIFREPGIYQMFLIYAYFLISLHIIEFRFNKFFIIMLIIGLISTFSMAGILTFIILVFIRHIMTKFTFKKVFLSVILIIVIIYSYDFLYRLVENRINSESAYNRFGTLQQIFKMRAISFLFGRGYFQDLSNISTVNLLGSFASIGLIGFILYSLIWIAALFNFRMYKLILLAPFFMTLLLAQPIYTDPIIFLMLLLSTKNFGVFSSSEYHI